MTRPICLNLTGVALAALIQSGCQIPSFSISDNASPPKHCSTTKQNEIYKLQQFKEVKETNRDHFWEIENPTPPRPQPEVPDINLLRKSGEPKPPCTACRNDFFSLPVGPQPVNKGALPTDSKEEFPSGWQNSTVIDRTKGPGY